PRALHSFPTRRSSDLKNPHHEMQGQACLALAQLLKNRTERTPAVVTGIRSLFTKRDDARPAKDPQKEAEELLERVVKEFGDVPRSEEHTSELQSRGHL